VHVLTTCSRSVIVFDGLVGMGRVSLCIKDGLTFSKSKSFLFL
jgi:hypothetical protein